MIALVALIAGDAEWQRGVTAYSMGAAAGSAIYIAFKRAENFNPWQPEDVERARMEPLE